MGTDEAMESELGLGELAGLTVANEADSLAYDVSREREDGKPPPLPVVIARRHPKLFFC